MSTAIADLYKTLFAGERLTLSFESKGAYESTRVAFSKLHQHSRLLLEITDDSLCSTYVDGIGTFWLGTPRRNRKYAKFTVIEDQDAQV